MILLRLHTPGQEPRELAFDDPVIAMGRDPTNQIVVDDKKASRFHCQIEREDGGTWKVVDNASANGTTVNGSTINFRRLETGDRIAIGDTRVEIVNTAGATPRPARSSRRTRPPAMAGQLDEPGPRSRRRPASRGSQMGVWILVIVVGLAGGGWILFRGARDEIHSISLKAAQDRLRTARFEEALWELKNIPPSSRHYAEAQALAEEIRREKARFLEEALEKAAKPAFERLEEWTRIKGTTRREMQGYIDHFLARYGDFAYAAQAARLIDRIGDDGVDEGGADRPESAPAGPKLSAYATATQAADSLLKRKQFGAAIEVLTDFWNENTGADAEAANQRITAIRTQAEKEWADLKFQIETHIKAGRKEKALELLWVADDFGIQSIVETAQKMANELEGKR